MGPGIMYTGVARLEKRGRRTGMHSSSTGWMGLPSTASRGLEK